MRAVDDLGIDAGAHGFEHGLAGAFAGEVDGAGAVVVQRDARLVRSDEGEHDVRHLTTGEKVRLKLVGVDGDARLGGGDAGIDDERIRHAAQPHGEQGGDADRSIGDQCAEPEVEKFRHDEEGRAQQDDDDAVDEEPERLRHGVGGWVEVD
jgi:hypothetical protein